MAIQKITNVACGPELGAGRDVCGPQAGGFQGLFKQVNYEHPRDLKKVAIVDRWSLFKSYLV
jgi:hypothetical protein